MLKLPENGHQKRATFKPVLQQIRSQQPNLLQDRFDSWVLKLATSLSNFFCRMLQNKLHVLGFRYIGTVRKKKRQKICVQFLAIQRNFLVLKSPLVSPRNDVWETSAEIPYWWRGWIKFPTRHNQSEAPPRSGYWHVISMEFLHSFLRRHFAMPPLVSPRNDVWETSAEIPYWWRVNTQIWVVFWLAENLLQPTRSTIQIWVVTRQQYLQSFLRCHFAGKTGGVAKRLV